jgi:phosphate transport system permease protein
MKMIDQKDVQKHINSRIYRDTVYRILLVCSTLFSLAVLLILLYRIFLAGFKYVDIQFLLHFSSRKAENAGIAAAFWGTIFLMAIVAFLSLLLGVGTALYLEEYAKKTALTSFIELNIQTLAGVPSVVFGLLGLTFFVYMMDLGQSLLAGGLTMSLLVLPTIVVASQEAFKAVPREALEASYGLGATKWQTMYRIVLPAAFPGIMTGCILALSRGIGETAPLLVIGALAFVNYLPTGIMDEFTVLPIQIFNWMSRPQEEFQYVAAAGIIVLLVLLFAINAVAIILRNRKQGRY